MEAVSGITEIPVFDLQHFIASTDRIKEKMAWAAKRQTTRVEDIAYSLIGIFNVTLVTAYGEGDKAFYRLQLEIMGKTDSVNIFVWSGEPSKECMLAGGPECFLLIDREDDFTRLIEPGPSRSKSQCEEDARILIPRGSQTFSISNSSLHMQLVLYDINVGEPYGLNFAGWANWIEPLNVKVQGELKVGILDYDRDDASGRSNCEPSTPRGHANVLDTKYHRETFCFEGKVGDVGGSEEMHPKSED